MGRTVSADRRLGVAPENIDRGQNVGTETHTIDWWSAPTNPEGRGRVSDRRCNRNTLADAAGLNDSAIWERILHSCVHRSGRRLPHRARYR